MSRSHRAGRVSVHRAPRAQGWIRAPLATLSTALRGPCTSSPTRSSSSHGTAQTAAWLSPSFPAPNNSDVNTETAIPRSTARECARVTTPLRSLFSHTGCSRGATGVSSKCERVRNSPEGTPARPGSSHSPAAGLDDVVSRPFPQGRVCSRPPTAPWISPERVRFVARPGDPRGVVFGCHLGFWVSAAPADNCDRRGYPRRGYPCQEHRPRWVFVPAGGCGSGLRGVRRGCPCPTARCSVSTENTAGSQPVTVHGAFRHRIVTCSSNRRVSAATYATCGPVLRRPRSHPTRPIGHRVRR